MTRVTFYKVPELSIISSLPLEVRDKFSKSGYVLVLEKVAPTGAIMDLLMYEIPSNVYSQLKIKCDNFVCNGAFEGIMSRVLDSGNCYVSALSRFLLLSKEEAGFAVDFVNKLYELGLGQKVNCSHELNFIEMPLHHGFSVRYELLGLDYVNRCLYAQDGSFQKVSLGLELVKFK